LAKKKYVIIKQGFPVEMAGKEPLKYMKHPIFNPGNPLYGVPDF
jgi:hypothetical protein